MLCVFYHNKINLSEPPPRVTTEESGLIATQQMLPARPAPSPPQQPRGEDCLLCSGLPASVLGDVSAPAPHGLTSASLTDPVLQALLQGSSKSRVNLSCRRLGAKFTSSQRDLCNPRVQGSARLQPESEETCFPDESRRSWELLCLCEKRRGWETLDLCPKALRPVLDWCSLNTQMTLT